MEAECCHFPLPPGQIARRGARNDRHEQKSYQHHKPRSIQRLYRVRFSNHFALGRRCGQPGQQQGRRSPSFSSATTRWIRRSRVGLCFADMTQQFHSFRASRVRLLHAFRAVSSRLRAARRSEGVLCKGSRFVALAIRSTLASLPDDDDVVVALERLAESYRACSIGLPMFLVNLDDVTGGDPPSHQCFGNSVDGGKASTGRLSRYLW
jgi:hypothetical protein